MNHRTRTFTLSLFLALSLPALATSAALPKTARVQVQATSTPLPTQPVKAASSSVPAASGLKKVISLQAGSTLTLPTALAAIAHSSGLNLITRDVPPLPLTQSLRGLTGQQALDLLLTVYGDTIGALHKGNTLIVGQKTFISTLNGDASLEVLPGVVNAEQAAALSVSIQGLRVVPFGDSTLLSGSQAATSRGKALLSKLAVKGAPTQTDVPVVHADVLVSPLAPGDAVEAVKAAWPSLRVAGTPTRVLLSGSSSDVESATALLGRLQADAVSNNQANLRDAAETSAREQAAKETAAKLAQASTPAAGVVPPAPVMGSARLALDLPDAVVMKLASSMDAGVKATLIQDGLYTVSGEQRALDAFTAAALELQGRNQSRPAVTYAVRGSLDDAAASLKQQLPSVSIMPLRASRQLLISASPDEHSRVVLLLKQIDRATVSSDDDAVTDIVRLSYAQASTVVSALSSSSPSGSGSAGPVPSTSTPGASVAPTTSGPTASAGGLSVTADARTNAVILSGPRRQVEQAKRVLQSLDVTLPNINVGLNVRQVSNSDGSDLGVNWQAGVAGISVGGGPGGLSVGYAPAAVSPSIKIDLAANQNRTTQKTLLDTTLTTQAGRASTLLSGGQLLVPVTNTTSSGGNTSTQQSRESYTYGLDITVTPRLAPDGTVELAVALTIGEKPVTAANGNIDIAKRTVTTIVTVKPGQAVTLGGLVSSDESAGNSGVPLLSSIPILGALFGKQNSAAGHTVLLITLTAAPEPSAVSGPVTPPPLAPVGGGPVGPVSVSTPVSFTPASPVNLPVPQTVNRGDGASSTTIPATK